MTARLVSAMALLLSGCVADREADDEPDAGVPNDVRGTWHLTFPAEMLAGASCADPAIPFPSSTTVVVNGSPWIISWDDRDFTHQEDIPGDDYNFQTSLTDTATGEIADVFVSVSQGQSAPWSTVTWIAPHPSEYCAISGTVEVDRTF